MKTEKQLEDQLWRVAQKLREKGNVNTLVKLYKRATDDITRFYLTYNISKVMWKTMEDTDALLRGRFNQP